LACLEREKERVCERGEREREGKSVRERGRRGEREERVEGGVCLKRE
jgi:hypothetical protein